MDLLAPMPLSKVYETIVLPAYAVMGAKYQSREATCFLLAAGFQESDFMYRAQKGNGPARGFWQFERGGGVVGIMTHSAVKNETRRMCGHFNVPFTVFDIWKAFERDDKDVFTACCARLLLYTDPGKLPALGEQQEAWDLYAKKLWRPGRPHPKKWPTSYGAALGFVLSLG